MSSVYILQHQHRPNDSDEEDIKLIGAYSTRKRAEDAIDRLRERPGFAEAPMGFVIDEYQLDADHWTEGFVTIPAE